MTKKQQLCENQLIKEVGTIIMKNNCK